MVQMVQHLPSKYKALSSNTVLQKKKKGLQKIMQVFNAMFSSDLKCYEHILLITISLLRFKFIFIKNFTNTQTGFINVHIFKPLTFGGGSLQWWGSNPGACACYISALPQSPILSPLMAILVGLFIKVE
jgi:hypothetical protein